MRKGDNMNKTIRNTKQSRRIVASILAVVMVIIMIPTAALAAEYDTLQYGDTGDAVTDLQQALYDKGYLTVSPTGYYGHLTENAVIAFQQANSLSIDGIAGPITQSALFGSSTSSATLRLGSSGSSVTTLQKRLHALGYLDYSGATGYYGSLTKTAVIRFQQQNGLSADGIAGSITQSALYASSLKA